MPTVASSFEAAPLDVPARLMTPFFWLIVATVWIGAGALLEARHTGPALVMTAAAAAMAALGVLVRQRSPLRYRLGSEGLVVERRAGALPLGHVHGARRSDEIRSGRTVRLLGSGGLYGYLGLFWIRGRGRVRVYVTDTRRAILLSAGERSVAVSPSDPDGFVAACEALDA